MVRILLEYAYLLRNTLLAVKLVLNSLTRLNGRLSKEQSVVKVHGLKDF